MTAYAAAIVQERAIAQELEAAEEATRRRRQGPLADRARACRGKPDAAGEGPPPRGDGAGPEPQPPPAWHGRAERPAAVGIRARG